MRGFVRWVRAALFGAPRLVLGVLRTIALPDDTRPAYRSWLHMPVMSVGRRGAGLCTVEVRVHTLQAWMLSRYLDGGAIEPERSDRSIFVRGFYSELMARLDRGETAYVPAVLQIEEATPHPLFPDVVLEAGAYLTGGTFLFHPELAGTQRLSDGDYMASVVVSDEAGRRTERHFGLQVGELAAAPIQQDLTNFEDEGPSTIQTPPLPPQGRTDH